MLTAQSRASSVDPMSDAPCVQIEPAEECGSCRQMKEITAVRADMMFETTCASNAGQSSEGSQFVVLSGPELMRFT